MLRPPLWPWSVAPWSRMACWRWPPSPGCRPGDAGCCLILMPARQPQPPPSQGPRPGTSMQHGSKARQTLQSIPTLTAGALDTHTARLDLHRHPLRDDQSARADKLLHGAGCLLQPGRQLPKRQVQARAAVSSALRAWFACYEAASRPWRPSLAISAPFVESLGT